MPNEDDKKPINNELENALKEFEDSGGFSGGSSPPRPPGASQQLNSKSETQSNAQTKTTTQKSQNNQKDKKIDDFEDFDDFLSDIPDNDIHKHTDDNDIEHDDISHEDLNNNKDFEDLEADLDNETTQNNSINNKNKGKGRSEIIIEKLKEPKNAVILVVAICFLLFLILQSGNKNKKIEYQNPQNIQEEVINDVSDVKKNERMESPTPNPSSNTPSIPLGEIELPNLDVNLPEIKKSDISLIPQIPEPKIPEPVIPEPKPVDLQIPEPEKIVIDEIEIKSKDDVPDPTEDILEIKPKKNRAPITEKTQLKPLVTDFSGGTTIPNNSSTKKSGHDFIFIDTDLDTEVEQNAISATRIQNPENIVSQGRIIDAVLETAINSTIGGQVRAIVTRDVYAEVGRNILIPKGTRLYGQYGSGGNSTAGARVIITWTRIMRPDNVSATINSFASDQFGRSGIEGQIDAKYFSSITSSLLLSAIPLVSTIVTNAITNTNPQTVTTGTAGNTTIIQDPINIATQSFTSQVSRMTSDIIKNITDTKPTVTLDQGTRIKVLVNQDIKLPTYKPVTRASSGVSGG
jgi:type IV secretion system protein VirB10